MWRSSPLIRPSAFPLPEDVLVSTALALRSYPSLQISDKNASPFLDSIWKKEILSSQTGKAGWSKPLPVILQLGLFHSFVKKKLVADV